MPTEEDLFELVGRGRISPTQVLDVIFPGLKAADREAATATRRIEGGKGARLYVRGGGLTPGVSLNFGQCCTPVPGDRIVGILEPDTGLSIHTIDCARLAEFADNDTVWEDLQWTPQAEQSAVGAVRLCLILHIQFHAAESEDGQGVAIALPGEFGPAQAGGFRVGRRRQDRAEQRVIEAQFAGAGDFLRVVAGSTHPGEVRSLVQAGQVGG